MRSTEFCYWLQGYFELTNGAQPLDVGQVEMIRKHLALVFIHEIDPSYPAEQQAALNVAHAPKHATDDAKPGFGGGHHYPIPGGSSKLIRC